MSKATVKVTFGEFLGNYAVQQTVIYGQVMKYLGLEAAYAHQFALNWASEVGRLTKGAGVTISIGKNKKTREAGRDIKGQLKIKGVQTTAPLDIADLLVRWEDLSEYGLHLNESELVLRELWAQYIKGLNPAKSERPVSGQTKEEEETKEETKEEEEKEEEEEEETKEA